VELLVYLKQVKINSLFINFLAKVSQRNVFSRTIILKNMLQINGQDRIYCPLPLYHSSGGIISLTVWHTGGSILLRRNFSNKHFWNDCVQYKATVFIYIGELCRYLISSPESENDKKHSVRLAVGNGLRPDIWSKFQSRFNISNIIEFYSSTEGSSLINLSNKPGAVGYFPWYVT
jgi:fatty-acyl-CoA synthase